MGEVIDLKEYRGDNSSHVCIHTVDGNAHIIPVSLIEDVIEGRKSITGIEDFEIVIRSILKEWLEDFEE